MVDAQLVKWEHHSCHLMEALKIKYGNRYSKYAPFVTVLFWEGM
jgi:hypothetical protein